MDRPPYITCLYLAWRFSWSLQVIAGDIRKKARHVWYDFVDLLEPLFKLLGSAIVFLLLPVKVLLWLAIPSIWWPFRKSANWGLTAKAVDNLRHGKEWTDGLKDEQRRQEHQPHHCGQDAKEEK